MVGDEYAKYFADTHAKAKKYTEWAKNPPGEVSTGVFGPPAAERWSAAAGAQTNACV